MSRRQTVQSIRRNNARTVRQATKKVEFNRSNWSGKTAILTYNDLTLEFSMDCLKGYKFRLERVETARPEVLYNIRGNNWDAEYSLGLVGQGGRDGDERRPFYAFANGIDRGDDNAFIASAQLLCNLI